MAFCRDGSGAESIDSYQTDNSETSEESDLDYGVNNSVPYLYSHDEIDTIIRRMWDTVLDHIYGYQSNIGLRIIPLSSITYLVFVIEGINKPGILKNGNYHAEAELEYILQSYRGPLKITIYINNSPCADCAKSLKKFLEKNENIQMVLYITHLYNIKRRSCILREKNGKHEKHTEWVSDEVHDENYEGLRNLIMLRGNRCRIEAFTKKVWEDLLNVTGLSTQMMNNYNRRKKGYDRSRQNEDRRIKKDLNGIKKYSDSKRYIETAEHKI